MVAETMTAARAALQESEAAKLQEAQSRAKREALDKRPAAVVHVVTRDVHVVGMVGICDQPQLRGVRDFASRER